MTERGDVQDLTDRRELTYSLLDDTWRWRERLVETLELGSANHVRVRSSYQVRLGPDLVRPFLRESSDRVRLLLPVTTRPKRPLVGFDVEADGTPAYLRRRSVLADVQSGYLAHLLRDSPVRTEVLHRLPRPLRKAIFAFTPGVFEDYRPGWPMVLPNLQLARYLTSGLGLAVSGHQVGVWLRRLKPAADTLVSRLEEPPDRKSSSECMLLALPLLEESPSSTGQIDRIVDDYVDAVAIAAEAGEDAFLIALAEYGRRWEVIVEATLPVDAPSLVKVYEDRPLRIGIGGTCTQRLWVGDAASHHTVIRVVDPAVTFIGKPEGRNPLGRLGYGLWEGRQVTDDAVSLYTSDAGREYFVDMTVRMRPTGTVWAPTVVMLVLAGAAIVAALVTRLDEDRAGPLGLLVVPMSFIAAVLLIREQTSLSAHLQKRPRLLLLLEMTALWLIAVHRLLNG